MKLFFVRHGQTDYNVQKVIQGQEIDSPLNDEGRAQASAAAEQLPMHIECVISSSLLRAKQTAEIINARLQKPFELNDDLKEFSFGSLAGKTWATIEIETGDKDIHDRERNIMFDFHHYGGESAADVKTRVSRFVAYCTERFPNQNILAVSHGGIIRTLHTLYPQADRGEITNGSIHEFDF